MEIHIPPTISKITEVLLEIVAEFKTRQICEKYFEAYIDAAHIPIRYDGTYEKQVYTLFVELLLMDIKK